LVRTNPLLTLCAIYASTGGGAIWIVVALTQR